MCRHRVGYADLVDRQNEKEIGTPGSMEIIGQSVYSPGPELSRLISDQVNQLRCSYRQIESVDVNLWIEEIKGAREKFCEISTRFRDIELRVTKHGSTHSLALLDAVRTVRRRINEKIKSRKL